MQFELFPNPFNEPNNQLQPVIDNNHQYEILLYANEDSNQSRDLVINTANPEGKVVFLHTDPENDINVFINGNVEIHGNLSITGKLKIKGEVNQINKTINHIINNLTIQYDVDRNVIMLNGKQVTDYTEIGYMLSKALKVYQEDVSHNDAKKFFNY